jgi:hypothetical protein
MTNWVKDICFRSLGWMCTVVLAGVFVIASIELLLGFERIASISQLSVEVAIPLAVAFVVPAFIFHALIHELGHLAAAFLMGMRPLELCVAWVRVQFDSPRWNVIVAPKPPKLCGFVRAQYPRNRAVRLRWLMFLLGGSVANFTAAAGLLLLASLINSQYPAQPPKIVVDLVAAFGYRGDDFYFSPRALPVAIFDFLATFGVMMGAINLIPLSGSDGAGVGAILKVIDPTQLFELSDILVACYGKRPREWGKEQVRKIEELMKVQEEDISCESLLYFHHLDCGRVAEAKQYLAVAVERMGHRKLFVAFWYESAYLHAYHLQDVAAAKAFLVKARSRVGHEPQTPLRADAAILFAEGKYIEARDKAWQAIEAMKGCLDVGGAIAEREWLATLAIEAEKRRAEQMATVTPQPASASADPSPAAF